MVNLKGTLTCSICVVITVEVYRNSGQGGNKNFALIVGERFVVSRQNPVC